MVDPRASRGKRQTTADGFPYPTDDDPWGPSRGFRNPTDGSPWDLFRPSAPPETGPVDDPVCLLPCPPAGRAARCRLNANRRVEAENRMGTFSRKVGRVVDCHCHVWGLERVEKLRAVRRDVGLDAMSIACIVNPRTGSGIGEGLCAKAGEPEAFYCFGGLNHAGAEGGGQLVAAPLAEQVDRMLATGADGVKLIEAKPTSRQKLPFALDGDYYRGFFARAEELAVPILWHVADPEEFWDPHRLPDWAARHHWGYGPDDVAKEQLYREVEAVLARHPHLRVVFAHFYFLSADLPRARRFLAEHPAVRIDLAPGVEFLFNLSARPDEARAFFIDHADRIVFGTDIGAGQTTTAAGARAWMVGRFLETADTFHPPADADELLEPGSEKEIVGLDLPAEVLEKIYHANFESFATPRPRPVDLAAAVALCRDHAALAANLSGTPAEDTEAAHCAAALAAAGR